jgi:hypothetical protein
MHMAFLSQVNHSLETPRAPTIRATNLSLVWQQSGNQSWKRKVGHPNAA